MGAFNHYNNPLLIVCSTLLLTLAPPVSAQSTCVFPEGGVSVGILIGACCAVLVGTLLFELVAYLAYQKWKKKRIKPNKNEPAVVYSPSTAVDIEAKADKDQSEADSVKGRSSSDSGRGSVFTISDSLDTPSFFDTSDGASRSNSVIDVANDFNPLKETYKINWKLSSDDLNIPDDYDVLEKAFPLSLPKLDAINFTSARYKSSEIKLVPDTQDIIVGVVVEGDRQSDTKKSSSTRTYRTTSHVGTTSRQSQNRYDERGDRYRRSHGGGGVVDDIAIEIVPDRPLASRDTRIEIDENFSIASTRRSESSDEDLYDYGDIDRRLDKTVPGHVSQNDGQSHRTATMEQREMLRRQVIEKRSGGISGSVAMNASGAEMAKTLGDGRKSPSRLTKSGNNDVRHHNGHDYHVAKREVVNGKEFITLVRADQPTKFKTGRGDQARSKSTRYVSRSNTTLPRSFSETTVDPRTRVSFRDPIESASDTNSIPTIGVIHLVDAIQEEPIARVSSGVRGRTKDRYQKKRLQRSRSESPIKYSERINSESQELYQKNLSSASRTREHQLRSRSTTPSGNEFETSATSASQEDVPTIGVVRLVSTSPHSLQNSVETSTSSTTSWPRLRESRSPTIRSASTEISQRDNDRSQHTYRKSENKREMFLSMVNASTQCSGPKLRVAATEPRIPWRSLLEEMEEKLTSDMLAERKSKSGKKKSTLSRLTSYKKNKKETSKNKPTRRSLHDRDDLSWDGLSYELQGGAESPDDRYFSEPEKEMVHIYRSSSAQSRGVSSTYSDKRRSQSKTERNRRSRSVSPGHSTRSGDGRISVKDKFTEPEVSWETLIQNVRMRIRTEDGRRGRSPVRRSKSDRELFHGVVDTGTQSDVSWGTLLRLMEARIEERVTKEQRYKKRSVPLVGKFSLKAEKKPQKTVAHMGTSPELSWGEFVDIATLEAERNMKSKSVPDLREEISPQNIGVFSLKETKDTKAPVRSTGTETDLSFSDLIDIVLEEINLTDKERSKGQRSISYDREMLIDRAQSLGIVQLRSKSEERVRRRDTGTQPDLSWAQLIDIVTDEARKMLIRRQTEISSEMGTDPIITWRHLVETIHEESGDFWRRKQRHSSVERSTEPDLSWHQLVDIIQEQTTIANRKQTTSRGIQPKWSWTEIVNVIQEETEEILRLKALSNMTSKATTASFATPSHMQGTQTDNDKTSVAVSTLRTWVRDRPRRVQWEDATEPEIEWDRLVREIEGAAIDEYIRAHGLDQPREAPVVSVFKLKKTQVETQKITTSDAATSPVLDWRLLINEVQEDAVESYKSQTRKHQDTIQRVPVAGVFKLKQEEKPRVEKHDTGTDPAFSWKNITEDIETSAIESYRRTRKSEQPTSMGVIKLKSTEKEKEKDDNFTQSDQKWSDIITDLREEFENEYRKTIRQLQSKLVDLEEIPKSLGVLTLKGPEGPSLIDTGTQPEWTWDVIINGVQEETEESIIRQQRRQRQRHLDSMLTTSVQVDVETVDAGIGDDVISKEDDFVEVRNASSQVSIRYLDKSSETLLSVSESGVQVIARTTDVGTSACQSTTDTGSDAIFFQMPSVGITCAPDMVDTHVTAKEQFMEVTSTAIQSTPQYSSIGITTIPFQLESKSTQCKHDVKDVSVEVTRSMADGFQQTQVGTTNVSLMTNIQRNVKQQGVQISSDCVTQSSQTEICTYDSSVMTDPVEEVQEVTIVAEVEQRSEASHEEQQVEQEVQATRDTFETWTFTDVAKFTDQETEVYITEFDDYDEKVVSTALFAQQIGDVNTHEISTVASPDTASVCTETVMADMESKHVQTLIDYVSRGSIAVPETSDFPTQTSIIEQNHFSGSFVPSMVEESIQSVQEMSEFSQHMQLFSSDRECQVAPEVPTYKNEGSMAKPEMNTLGTECYVSDDESDTDSGIDIDCQTHPVLVFSMEEFEQIKIEMNEYRQMQERMKELNERLKEFEDMALLKDNLEQVDIGIETDCKEFENDATQTLLSPVKVESSQTATVDLTDRSSSPINHEVRETVIQTIPLQTKDISTEVDEGTSQNQSVQATANLRNVGTETDSEENHSKPMQATVHSQQASCQYDRNDQDIGVQVGKDIESVHQGSQVDVIMKSSATETEIKETNASTQSSPIVRDNESQYESSEKDRGSQTVVKQLVETSTETQAEFVPMQATVESQQASCQYDRNDQDIGVQVETSIESVHQGSQVDVIMKSNATSTEITETNASTQSSPIVRDNDSQYESSETDQGSQTVVKQLVETSTETQAEFVPTVESQQASCQYDRNDQDIGVQVETSTESVHQGSQVDVIMKSSATSTEITETNASTQSSPIVRDNDSQYESSENDQGSQTVVKQLVETSTETQAEFVEKTSVDLVDAVVHTETSESTSNVTQTEVHVRDSSSQVENPENSSSTQTDEIDVKDEMLDPIVVLTTDAYVQANQPVKDSLCSITQTEDNKPKLKDTATSFDLSVSDAQIQTTLVTKESASSQAQQEMFSSLTQTDQEEKVKVVESSTWMDLSYHSFNGQTDLPSRENQGVQYQSASHDTESQTSPVLTLENAVNTISKESTDNSAQTFETKQVNLVTRDSEVQHSPEADDCSSQTLHMSLKHSFTETDEKVVSDQMVGTNEISLKDTGSQADVSVCSQLSQSEICMRAMESQTAVVTTAETGTSFASLVTMNDNSSQYDTKLGTTTETQTDVLSTSDVSTLYEISSHIDGTTQYEGHADDRGVQTEPKTVAFKQTSTDELILTIKETQTEREKKVDVVDHVAQTFVENNDVGVTVNIENEKNDTGVQVYAETQDKEFSCDFKEIEYIAVEKEVEIKEASVLHQQSSSTFHNQFDELKMPQEETGTIVRPDSSVIGNQFNPETSIFSIGTVVQTNDIGTSFETAYQNEISSQVTPDADIKSTQVQTTTTQRSLSPLPIPTLFASTQISLQPVHTTTLQIQVNEGSEAYTEDNIEENVISVVDATTQTNVSSIVTTTQTVPEKTVMQLPSRVDTMVDVRQDNRQRSIEFHPVQHSRGTATYNSIRKEMGTQFITREVVRKSHSRRDVALTSEGTFMDLTTRTTSSTQTMRTPMVNSGAQVMPLTSSVGVYSDIKPRTVSEGINTQPRMVRDVPVQIEIPERRVDVLIEKHVRPETTRPITPNTMEKLEMELIEEMKTELKNQLRKEVEAEYVTEILPSLIEEALREKLAQQKRSRPKSRDAVTSPLRGRSVERSLQHSESWPFSSTEAPEPSYLNEKELHVLRENTRRDLKHELKDEVKREIEMEVRKEVAREVEEDVRRQVAKDVEANVRNLIEDYVREDVIKELKEELRDSVKREVAFEVRSDIKREVALDVRHEVKREIAEEVRDEVKLRVRGEIKKSVEEALREEMKPFVTRDLRDTLKNTVKSDLRNEMTWEVRNELADKMESEVKKELIERYRSEVYNQKEREIKNEIKETVRQELEPRLREEIEKELREDITHELQVANLALVTSQKSVVIDKGISAHKLKVRSIPTQVDCPTNDQGVQVTEMKPQSLERISQTQPTVMERGTTTQKRLLKEFTIQIEPVVSETGTSPALHVSTKTFGLQTDLPMVDRKQRSDQYVYIPPRIDEGTQSMVINALTSTPVQATPQRDEKSVFHDSLTSSSSSTRTHGTDMVIERRNQGVQAHRTPLPGRPAQVQTSDDFGYTSSSMQFQPATKEASTGSALAQQQISTESQTVRRVRDVPIQFASRATYQDNSTSAERLVDTSDRYVQIGPVLRDSASSPVLFPSEESSQLLAQKSVAGSNVQKQTSLSQIERNLTDYVHGQDHQEVQSMNHHLRSSSSDHHTRKLNSIKEEPVKLIRNTKVSRKSDAETARLDAELYNLLKQAESLGSISSSTSKSKTSTINSNSTESPAQMVNVATTILQKLPPRCQVMILQASTPSATYTTAVLTTSNVSPTMSTGYHHSTWSRGTAVLPSLFGQTRGPMQSLLHDTANKETRTGYLSGRGKGTNRNGKAGQVRFADQEDLRKKETEGKREYSYSSSKTSTRRSEPIPVSKKMLELESRSSKGITTRLNELYGGSPPVRDDAGLKGGVEGDIDTGDSENDADHLKSILRVRKTASQGSGYLLKKRSLTENGDEMTTDSDGSSVCDQYDVSGAIGVGDSSSSKSPVATSILREKGKVKQDLSMSGVIESKSTTLLTGYRAYDSSSEHSTKNKKYTAYSGYQKPERDLKK